MRLLSLHLSNFKGAKDVTIRPNGSDMIVYGANGVGKTTLADAWSWALFGKDSRGKADFEIKTLQADGKPHSMLDHAVQAEIEDEGGRRLTLRRVYKETYTKKRGNAATEFTGHTTDYFVNDVPVKESEYAARVSSVCPEAKFRVLSDPAQLVERAKWQDRRKVLLEMIGDVSDADVIASKHSLKRLPDILGEHSIDDLRKILGGRRKAINSELEAIPNRIDEANRALPTIPSGNWDETLAAARKALTEAQGKRSELVSGGELAARRTRLREIDGEMIDIANRLKAEGNPERDAALSAARKVDESIRAAESEAAGLRRQIQSAEGERDRLSSRLEAKRKLAREEQAKRFEGESVCPSCGQELPEDRVQAATEAFNGAKANRLGEMVREGKALAAEYDEAVGRVAELVQKEDAADLRLSGLRSDRAAIQVPEATVVDPAKDREYMAKERDKAKLENEIASLRDDAATALSEIDGEIKLIQIRVDEASGHILAAKQRGGILERIETLGADEKRLASEFEKLEGDLFLTEEFVRAKVSMLTGRINGMFSLVRFRLFEDQINGGLTECCDVTVNGVPYGSLNTASQINAGLDVIDALARHMDFAPPIFVDRCESVTDVRPTLGQQIRLVVSAADKTLRCETVPRGATPPDVPAATVAEQEPVGGLF